MGQKPVKTGGIIGNISGIELLDSRGYPTVGVELRLDSGELSHAMVPSGASTGRYEAFELRDHQQSRFHGRGVTKAIDWIEKEIKPKLIGRSIAEWQNLDQCLIAWDGTPQKTRLGANTLLAVSWAMARAHALWRQQSLANTLGSQTVLPVPLMNVINGGMHAENPLAVQEFMLVPHGFDQFHDALRSGVEIYHCLKARLKKQGLSTNVGDEGGFAPHMTSVEQACEILLQAIEDAGYDVGTQVSLALDVASSEFYQDSHYQYDGQALSRDAWVKQLITWQQSWPICSIEDGCSEDDWEGWKALTDAIGHDCQLVGDDLFVTQVDRLQRGIDCGVANSILIKPNQVGTLSETLHGIELAQANHYGVVISHRSGDTEDCGLADLAFATGAGQIKTGAPCRSERTAKYNRLLWLAYQYEEAAFFDGKIGVAHAS